MFQIKQTQITQTTSIPTSSPNVISNTVEQTSNNILLYADPHFASTSSVLRKRGERFSARLEGLIKTINWINALSGQYNADIYCLGDLFDRSNLTAEEITAVKQCDFSKHTVILGNHEIMGREDVFTTVFAAQPKSVINQPCKQGDIGFLPYCPHTHMWDLQAVQGCKVLLSHVDITGIQNGTYFSKVGYEVTQLTECANLVINGHLHTRNWVIPNKLLNLGACVGMNFSSTHEESKPAVMLLNMDTMEYKFFENPYSPLFFKHAFTKQEDVVKFLDSLQGSLNVISLKVPDTIIKDIRNLIDTTYADKIYYSRIEPDYSFSNFEAAAHSQELPKLEIMDGMESLKKFVLEKFDKDNTNLKVMLEEIEVACK